MNDMRDLAVALAAKKKLRLFKLEPGTKRSAVQMFYDLASADPEKVYRSWTCPASSEAMPYNIGISTGYGLLVLDVDVKGGKPGLETLNKLIKDGLLDLRGRYIVRTPSGGLHIYGTIPADLIVSGAVEKWPGVDVRAHHNLVVGVGSEVGGKEYVVEQDGSPFVPFSDALVRELPRGMVRDAPSTAPIGEMDTEQAIARARDYLTTEAPEAILHSGMNNQVYKIACRVRDYGIGEYMCAELMADNWNETKAFPPLPVSELEKIIENAYMYAKKTPGNNSAEFEFGAVEIEDAPPPQPADTAPAKIIRPSLFTWQDPATILPRQWLYDRHYIRQFVSATIAPGGVGKSSMAIVEALAMVTGKPLLGVMPRQVCRVWYWCGEDPLDEIKRRVAAACLRHDIAPENIGDRLYLDSGRTSEIIMATAGRDGVTIAKPMADAILRAITDFRIDAMIVDPFVSSHRIGENDNAGMDMVVKQWARIADRTSSAIELVHHSRKTGGSEVTIEDARGGGAFGNAIRSGRVINTMTNDEAEKARVDNRRLFFRVDNGKANLAPPSDHAVWRHLVSVPLGNGDDVGVVTSWKWPDAMEGVTQDDFGRVAEVIRGGQWREHHSAGKWVGYAVADALDLDTDDKHDRAKITGMVKSWLKTGALQVVEALDAERKKRRFVVAPEHNSEFAPVS